MSLCLSWLVFSNLIQPRVTGEQVAYVEELSLSGQWVDMFVESFLDSCLMGEGPAPCRQCHPWTGSTWYIRSRLSNVVMSIPSQSPASFCSCLQGPPSLTSCPDFFPWWSVNSDGINPFLSKILFVMMVFLTVIESQLE